MCFLFTTTSYSLEYLDLFKYSSNESERYTLGVSVGKLFAGVPKSKFENLPLRIIPNYVNEFFCSYKYNAYFNINCGIGMSEHMVELYPLQKPVVGLNHLPVVLNYGYTDFSYNRLNFFNKKLNIQFALGFFYGEWWNLRNVIQRQVEKYSSRFMYPYLNKDGTYIYNADLYKYYCFSARGGISVEYKLNRNISIKAHTTHNNTIGKLRIFASIDTITIGIRFMC